MQQTCNWADAQLLTGDPPGLDHKASLDCQNAQVMTRLGRDPSYGRGYTAT
jgi:hypothetical protein